MRDCLIYFETLTTLNNFLLAGSSFLNVSDSLMTDSGEGGRCGEVPGTQSGPRLQLRHGRPGTLTPGDVSLLSWRLLGSQPTGTPDQAGARPEQCQPHHSEAFSGGSTLPVQRHHSTGARHAQHYRDINMLCLHIFIAYINKCSHYSYINNMPLNALLIEDML